jgi:hypothetical protein
LCAFSSNARGLGPGAPLLILYTPPTLVKHIWLRWSLRRTLQGAQGKSSGFDVSIKLRTVVIIFSNLDGLLAPSIHNKRFDIPLDLTGDRSAYIFQFLDTQLNCGMLYALLHGVYTGILAVTLWNICELAPLFRIAQSSINVGRSDEPWSSLSFSSTF